MIWIVFMAGDSSITVLSEGVASIHYSEDVARDRAIDDALRRAVEQALGTFVSSETIVKNYRLIEDRILSRAEGYVSSYRIVSEEIEDSLYRVRILAEVRKGKLEEDAETIKNMVLRKGRPLIYVESKVPFVRNYFITHLKQDGFSVIEDTTRRKPDLILKVDFGEEWEDQGTGYDAAIRLFTLHIAARIMDPRTGEVVASYTDQRTYPNMNTRIRNEFLEDAYREIKGTLLEEWSSGRELTVIIIKGGDDKFLKRLKDILRTNVRDLESMTLKRYREGYGELEIVSADNAGRIYDILLKHLDDASIEIDGKIIRVRANSSPIRTDRMKNPKK